MADTPSKKGGKGTKAAGPGKKAQAARSERAPKSAKAAPKRPAVAAKSGSAGKAASTRGKVAKPMQKPRKATPILMGKPEEEGDEGAASPMQKPRKATPILMGKPKEEGDEGAASPMQKPRKATPILMGKPEEEGDEGTASPMRAPAARPGKKARTPDETTEPLGTPVAEEGAVPRAAAPQAAEAPGSLREVPRKKVDVTAFPRKARPAVPERFAEIEAPAAGTAEPTAPAPAAPTAAAPAARAPKPPPASASAPAPAPERPRPPAEPAPRWVEASDVLVEGFFLTPEPRFAQTSAEPIGEGFFVARVAGEEAARRHGLTDRPRQGPPDSYDEDLGDFPVSYGEDDVLALPRDPHSLFFFWDFKAPGGGRAVLRVFDGDQLIREVEFTPEQRSFYLHDLPAGRTYRLEAHLVDASGATRLIGHAKMVSLPGEGSVRTTEVRFLKLPWHLALARLREYLREGHAQVEVVQGKEAFAAWIRTPLPSSAALQEGIVGERVVSPGEGEGPESVGHWRPSPSGQSWSK